MAIEILKSYETHAVAVGAEQCAARVVNDHPGLKEHHDDVLKYYQAHNTMLDIVIKLDNTMGSDTDSEEFGFPKKLKTKTRSNRNGTKRTRR